MTREPSADFYRVVAVVVVVIGHWLVSAVTYRNGQFGNEYPLDVLPWTQWLTLVFQVVPVFFLVGGYASAASLTRWRDGDGHGSVGVTEWVRTRLGAILGPTTAYVALVLGVIAVLSQVGIGGSPLSFGGWAVAMHLWFIPAYLAVLALTPLAVAAHHRWNLWVPVALATAVLGVDVAARIGEMPAVGSLNYLLCWAAVYQLGICWRAGAFSSRQAMALAAGAAVVVAALLGLRWYPISMVGAPGADTQNNFPPNIALLAFGTAQAGLLMAAAPAVTRWLRRSWLRRALPVANTYVMALYLWQMVPVVIVALIGYPTGLLPQPETGTGPWWLFRVGWLMILTVVMAVALALLWLARSVFDRALPTVTVPLPTWSRPALLAAGVALAVGVLARIAVYGFAPSGQFPTMCAALYVVAIGLLSVTTPSSTARREVAQ